MKRTKPLQLFLAAIGVVLLAAGCASAQPNSSQNKSDLGGNPVLRVFNTPVIETNYITVPVTNYVLVPVEKVVTNVVAVPGEARVVTNTVAETIYVTNTLVEARILTNYVVTGYELNSRFAQGVGIAQQVNSLNPTPSSPFINYGLSGLIALASAMAAYRSKKIKDQHVNVLETVIEAVESFPGATLLKPHIREAAVNSGTQSDLHEIVQKVTNA